MRVPRTSLIGTEEGLGFIQLMEQLLQERLIIAVAAAAAAEAAVAMTPTTPRTARRSAEN